MIIYLNGTSSSGKTTVAKLIQEEFEGSYFYFSIDSLLYSLPEKTLKSIESGGDLAKQLDWQGIFASYFECLMALSRNGQNVIGDCPIYSQKQFDCFKESIGEIKEIVRVGIDCPLEILNQREKDRGDRAIGLAASQAETIHQFLPYDLKVDSSEMNPQEIVDKIKVRSQCFRWRTFV
ncbi:MAG: chloramphenicol phosphotransferase CPT family protein [Bacteriovoracaceae bacterium]